MVFATNWFPIWSGTIPIQVKLEMSGGGVHSEIIEVEFPSYGGSERWHESDLFSSEPEDGDMKTKGFQLARDSERSPVHGHWHGKAVRVQPQGDMSQNLGDCRKLKGDGVPAEKTKPPLPGQRRAPTLLSPKGPAALPGAPFVDHEFDIADKRTLESGPPLQGKWSGVSEARGTHIEWFRAPEVVEKMTFGGGDPPVLFDHGAGAEDIAQGKLDDCWLLASLNALARQPGAVESLFSSNQLSADGRYELRLWRGGRASGQVAQRVTVIVDDFIPCICSEDVPVFNWEEREWRKEARVSPLGAAPSGSEIWPMLVEKAFAKFCGSYQALHYGYPAAAMEALTGADRVLQLTASQGGRWNLRVVSFDLPRWQGSYKTQGRVERTESGAVPKLERHFKRGGHLFDVLENQCALGHLITAISKGQKQLEAAQCIKRQRKNLAKNDPTPLPILQKHCYTVVDAVRIEHPHTDSSERQLHTLICVDNPYGRPSPWKGVVYAGGSDYGRSTDEDDAAAAAGSTFWLSAEEFEEIFDTCSICMSNPGFKAMCAQAQAMREDEAGRRILRAVAEQQLFRPDVFAAMDVDHDGYMSVHELELGLGLREVEARMLMALLDRDGDGRASLAEVAQLSALRAQIAELKAELSL